jgi:hypothetical protein
LEDGLSVQKPLSVSPKTVFKDKIDYANAWRLLLLFDPFLYFQACTWVTFMVANATEKEGETTTFAVSFLYFFSNKKVTIHDPFIS